MKFSIPRLFFLPRPGAETPPLEETRLQEAIVPLEARLAGLSAERSALERLVALRPGSSPEGEIDALERDFGAQLGGPVWERLKAWFRGRP